MKRIAILGTRGIPAKYGGFETAAEAIAVGLQESGLDVSVACEGQSNGHFLESATFRGVRLVYVPVDGSFRWVSEIIYDIRSLWILGRTADIIYIFGYGAGFAFWLAKLLRKSLIVNPDGLEWARPKFGWIARQLLRVNEFLAISAADVVVADSVHIKEHIQARYGKRAHYLPYGTQLDLRPKEWDTASLEAWNPEVARLKPDDYYLILARLEPDNNIAQILEGFAASESSRKLLVVGPYGSPKYEATLKAIATGNPRIILAGPTYNANIKAMLRWNCAAYLHGHMVGGTNPSLLEALASGNVVLATDVPFNREVVGTDGRYPARFFRPVATEITACVDEVDRELIALRERARLAGPARIKKEYDWGKIVEGYSTLLDRL